MTTTLITKTFESEAAFQAWQTELAKTGTIEKATNDQGERVINVTTAGTTPQTTSYKIEIQAPVNPDPLGAYTTLDSQMDDLLRLMIVLATVFKELRAAGLAVREAEYQNRATEINNAADSMRKSGKDALMFAVASAAVNIAFTGVSAFKAARTAGASNSASAELKVSRAQDQFNNLKTLDTKLAERQQLLQNNPQNVGKLDSNLKEINTLKKEIGTIKDWDSTSLNSADGITQLRGKIPELRDASIQDLCSTVKDLKGPGKEKVEEITENTEKLGKFQDKAKKFDELETKLQERSELLRANPQDAKKLAANQKEIDSLLDAVDQNNSVKLDSQETVNNLKNSISLRKTENQDAIQNTKKVLFENADRLNAEIQLSKSTQDLQIEHDEAVRVGNAGANTANVIMQTGNTVAKGVDGVGQMEQADTQADIKLQEGIKADSHQKTAEKAQENLQTAQEMLRSIMDKLKTMIELKQQAVSSSTRV
jgi:hypothetical protein